MGLKPDPSNDTEMPLIPSSAVLLLLIATSLAEPLRVNVNCKGQGTSCNGSFTEGSSDNSSFDAVCVRVKLQRRSPRKGSGTVKYESVLRQQPDNRQQQLQFQGERKERGRCHAQTLRLGTRAMTTTHYPPLWL